MSVYITKTGLKHFEWDGELRQNVEQPIKTFVSQLRSACHIEPDVTLGDIFKAVDQDELLCFFLGEYSWCSVKAFHAEALKPSLEKSDLKYIELSKYVDLEDSCGDPGEHIDVSGIGKPHEHHNRYAIDLTPVNELACLPVRLNPVIKFRKDLKTVSESPGVCFSLLEVLGEIYYEVSFHGSPQQREGVSLHLESIMREIENGTAELVPFESVFEDEKVQ
jgi:hypothetical protein